MGAFYEIYYICDAENANKFNKKITLHSFRIMKKLLFAALAMAIALTACNNQNNTNANATEATAATEQTEGVATTGKIAFYHIDRVLAEYTMSVELQTNFQKEYEAKDKELGASARKLEKDFNALQEKINKVLITRADAEKEAAKLQERQANLQARSEKAMAELAEKEQVMTNQIMFSINEFVNALNADLKYDLIFASSVNGGPIVNANPALDLTDEIIEGLNKQYATSKK